MSDTVTCLRRDADAADSGPAAILWREAADEIERLRIVRERAQGLLTALDEDDVGGIVEGWMEYLRRALTDGATDRSPKVRQSPIPENHQ